MRKDIRAKCDRGVGGSRWFIESPFFIPKTMRGILLTILLAGFGWQALSASPNSDPPALIVRRTAHGFQHKFIIRPSEPTVAADQVQRFEVTDAQGKPVAVHWNVSGLGCSGLACGSIDDKGVYRTPASLPEPQVVTLEGVLVSDPNYSVLTQIQLACPCPCLHPGNSTDRGPRGWRTQYSGWRPIPAAATCYRAAASGSDSDRCLQGFAAVAAECGYCAACHGATKHRPWLVTTRAASCNCRCPVRWKPDRFAQSHSHNASPAECAGCRSRSPTTDHRSRFATTAAVCDCGCAGARNPDRFP